MKRLFPLFIYIFSILNLQAQNTSKADTSWKCGGLLVFTISQTNFKDWAGGGENSFAGNSRLGLYANYANGNTSWENNLDMAYGLSKQDTQDFRKNDDILELNSKYGYKASEKLNYSAFFNVKTQFYEGRKYFPDTSIIVSKFAAPLYINFAVGIDYKPNKYTSVFLSPVNSKLIYVNDKALSTLNSLDSGQTLRYEFGFIAKMKYEKDIVKNVNLMSKLDLFADYLHFENLKDVYVNWEVLITMKVFKSLSVNLNTNLIWDNKVKSINKEGIQGDPKLQFKEIFGAGLSYKF